ncbi:MAG: hypothetical protein FWE84_03055, partial [Firmicutes bacterium]|nr:hypothetical protein [Bacillota bacterium]
ERSKRLMDKVVGTMKVDLVKTEYPYTNKKGVEVMGYNYALTLLGKTIPIKARWDKDAAYLEIAMQSGGKTA